MILRLRTTHTGQIHAHLLSTYPEEGCGVLLGREVGDVRVVERVAPLVNRHPDSRHNRYLIAPENVLEAEREAREAGLDVVGFFHSHPDHSAAPSAFDLKNAWPYYVYLIVSVERGRVADARAWRLAADRSRFEHETLEEMPDGVASSRPASPEA